MLSFLTKSTLSMKDLPYAESLSFSNLLYGTTSRAEKHFRHMSFQDAPRCFEETMHF